MSRPCAALAVDQPAHGSLSSVVEAALDWSEVVRLDAVARDRFNRWRARTTPRKAEIAEAEEDHAEVLAALRRAGPGGATVAQLMSETGIRSHLVSRSAYRLGQRGLVRREQRAFKAVCREGCVFRAVYVAVGAGEVAP